MYYWENTLFRPTTIIPFYPYLFLYGYENVISIQDSNWLEMTFDKLCKRLVLVLHTLYTNAWCYKVSWSNVQDLISNVQGLPLLLQKAQHRDSDTAGLANYLTALYFRRWKTCLLHTLNLNAFCFEFSICNMSIILIFMVQWLLKKKLGFFVVLISLLLW